MTDEELRPVQELTLPGPDDPVAWRYIQHGTPVIGSDGERLGTVDEMVGDDTADIFTGVLVGGGFTAPQRTIPADHIVNMTPSRVEVSLDRDAFERIGSEEG
jgi:uncharacterized protein YrrD